MDNKGFAAPKILLMIEYYVPKWRNGLKDT